LLIWAEARPECYDKKGEGEKTRSEAIVRIEEPKEKLSIPKLADL